MIKLTRLSKYRFIVLSFFVLLSILAYVFIVREKQVRQITEANITADQKEEAISVIEHFHMQVGSFEAQQDPSLLSEVLTGPLLEAQLIPLENQTRTSLYVTSGITLGEVRIPEYSSSRLISIACGSIYRNRVSSDGALIESLEPSSFKNIYVFIREDGIWKVAVSYSLADADTLFRDLEHAANWEKEYSDDLIAYFRGATSCKND